MIKKVSQKKEKKEILGKKRLSLKELSMITVAAGLVLLYVNFTFFSEFPQIFAAMNLIAAFIVLGIPLLYRYGEYKKLKKIELVFPRYLKDVADSIATGMTLPQSMKSTLANDYGVLNPYVKELSAKVSWGISFDKAIRGFAEKTKSKSLKRNVETIIETYRSGGQVSKILVSVAESLQELERIKKERSASVYAQMINGYLIYIVFLGVMIGLSTILVPAFGAGQATSELQGIFTELFRALTIIQGFFAGLAIGKMAEGTLTAGIKHSMVLVILGYSAFVLFI